MRSLNNFYWLFVPTLIFEACSKMWEKWHDAMDGNSLLKAACDTIGRPC